MRKAFDDRSRSPNPGRSGLSRTNRRNVWTLLIAAGLVLVFLGILVRFHRSRFLPIIGDVERFEPSVAQAITNAVAAVQSQPNSAAAWGNLASLLRQCELFKQAEEAFVRSQRLAPRDPRWVYLHGVMLMDLDPERALALLRRAAEIEAKGPEIIFLRLAQFELEQGDLGSADARFSALLNRDPNNPQARLGLARVRQIQNRLVECQQLLVPCLTNVYTRRGAHVVLSNVLLALGDSESARAASRRCAELPADLSWPDPISDEASRWRVGRKMMIEDATLLLDQDRPDEALKALSAVLRDHPRDPDGWYLSGWALNRVNRHREAESALREHLRLLPGSARGLAQLGVSLLAQQRYVEAMEVLQKAVVLKPSWRELHANLGYACVVQGSPQEALEHYRRAVECDPNHLPTLTALAELLIRKGDREKARAILQRASEMAPGDARVQRMLEGLEQTP